MRLRTSPSDLEAVRFYHQVDDPDLDRLLSRLLRLEPPNEDMEAGSAFHTCVEQLPVIGGRVPMMSANGYTFEFAPDVELLYLPPLREVKAEKVYMVDDVEVTVACVTDAMDATTVYDHKLSKKCDPEKYYLSSMQWRVYLDVFDCQRFVYNVFVCSGTGMKRKIRELNRISMYAYPEMEQDIRMAIREYINICREHLPEKITE